MTAAGEVFHVKHAAARTWAGLWYSAQFDAWTERRFGRERIARHYEAARARVERERILDAVTAAPSDDENDNPERRLHALLLDDEEE